jgi:chorismate lyase
MLFDSVRSSTSKWRPMPPRTLPRVWTEWLQRPGSLTEALRTLGSVEVQVISEGLLSPAGAFWSSRAPARRGPVWARDVILAVDGTAVIAARSITAAIDARAAWKSVKFIGARPLASILYRDRTVSRSPFLFSPFTPTPVIDKPSSPIGLGRPVWGRSSFFYRARAPLLVTEIFLPDLWSYLRK